MSKPVPQWGLAVVGCDLLQVGGGGSEAASVYHANGITDALS